MEMLDVYNINGKPTGQMAPRGTILPDGNFFLCTHIFLENMNHQFLIQQRSNEKLTRPGQWDITAGAVDSGEDSLVAAIRETQEEVGLILKKDKLHFLFRDRLRCCFHDMYYASLPFRLEDCTMQASEVQALRLVFAEELSTLIQKMSHRSDNYKKTITQFLQNGTISKS